MSETVILWILGILITVVLALAAAIFNHVRECREPRTHIATLEAEVDRIKEDIGTHDSGMRGHIHRHDSLLSAAMLEIELIKRKRDER